VAVRRNELAEPAQPAGRVPVRGGLVGVLVVMTVAVLFMIRARHAPMVPVRVSSGVPVVSRFLGLGESRRRDWRGQSPAFQSPLPADGPVRLNDPNGPHLQEEALRGGAGKSGVVTSFTFDMHPVGQVVAGPMLWPLDRAEEILAWYREFLPAQPEELNGFFAFLTVPPAPPFPPELHLQKMAGVVWCFIGTPEEADVALEPARRLQPALDGVAAMPYPALQSAFDALYPPGDQWYWRADFVRDIPDEAIERHVQFARLLPSWKTTTSG
jgi:hypothetical protein